MVKNQYSFSDDYDLMLEEKNLVFKSFNNYNNNSICVVTISL